MEIERLSSGQFMLLVLATLLILGILLGNWLNNRHARKMQEDETYKELELKRIEHGIDSRALVDKPKAMHPLDERMNRNA